MNSPEIPNSFASLSHKEDRQKRHSKKVHYEGQRWLHAQKVLRNTRSLHEGGELDSTNMANCLMLLSQGRGLPFPSYDAMHNNPPSRVFECTTCNRKFPSFQALGGHRASHKKPKMMVGNGSLETQSPVKPRTHECSICGLEFAIGQALGGHMRRHRAALNSQSEAFPLTNPGAPLPKTSDSRRVLCLDLNLTPYENDMEIFKVGKAAPMVDCFF